jgi:hypothetical protein
VNSWHLPLSLLRIELQRFPLKKWIGHGSEEMIRRYTHLRPDFMRDELARVPDFAPKNASKIVEMPRLPHN